MKKTRKSSAPAGAEPPLEKEVLRVTTGSLKIPTGIDTDSSAVQDAVSRVVALIVGLALIFIAIIAWLIHQTA